jgi:nucleoside-diphosphate-sugar epimerase
MGVHLVKLLSQHAKRVVVTSRSKAGSFGNIEYATGNARDQAFVSILLNTKWDAIIDFMIYPTKEFQQRYPLLLRATGHYIYLSSGRVYSQSDIPLKEDSPRLLDVCSDQEYLATDEYALAKARQENFLFDGASRNWTIVRPYITFHHERLQLGIQEKEDWLYRALRCKTVIDCADIQSKQTTMTFGLDVARVIFALIGQKDAKGEVFNVTADKTVLWSEVLNIYLAVLHERLGKRPKVSLQPLNNFMRLRQGKYQAIYDRMYNREFDNRKIQQFIDTSSFKDPLQGLTECLNQFFELPKEQFKTVNWRREALKDRLIGEHTPCQAFPSLSAAANYCILRYTPISTLLRRH